MVIVEVAEKPLPSAAVARTTQLRGKVPPVVAVNVVVATPLPSVLAGLKVSLVSQPETFVQLTFRLLAFAGLAVAEIGWVPPPVMVAVVGLTETLVTSTGLIVMVEVAEKPLPSAAVARTTQLRGRYRRLTR